MIPPARDIQLRVLAQVETRHQGSDPMLRNSLCQFDCHSHFFSKRFWYLYNLISVFIVPVLLFVLLIKPRPSGKKKAQNITLFPRIPSRVQADFNPQFVSLPFGTLRFRDVPFVSKILFKSGFRPYFKLRTLWKLAAYSDLIDLYSPQSILVTQEMTFESSLLTEYLDSYGICHVNFMHGDKIFSIQDAFSSFHVFYVWEDFYKRLFESLKCKNKQYLYFEAIQAPIETAGEENRITYYHQFTAKPEQLMVILQNLLRYAKIIDSRLVVRLHPLMKKPYEIEALEKAGVEIEPNSVPLAISIKKSRYVCSEWSSVLYQASLMKKKLIVDNSFPQNIERLKELNFIVLDKLEYRYLVES